MHGEKRRMDEKAIQSTILELMEMGKRAFSTHLQTGTGGNLERQGCWNKQCCDQAERRRVQRVHSRQPAPCGPRRKDPQGIDQAEQGYAVSFRHLRVRPEINGIVHVHSPWATAWATLGEEIPTLTVQAQSKFGKIPLVPSGLDGSKEAAEAVIDAFRNPAVLVATLQNRRRRSR